MMLEVLPRCMTHTGTDPHLGLSREEGKRLRRLARIHVIIELEEERCHALGIGAIEPLRILIDHAEGRAAHFIELAGGQALSFQILQSGCQLEAVGAIKTRRLREAKVAAPAARPHELA